MTIKSFYGKFGFHMALFLSREVLSRQRSEKNKPFPNTLIKSLKIFRLDEFEKEKKDGIKREVVQIEDINGNRADVIVYQSAQPLRRDKTYIFDTFKKHTHIARMHIENKKFDLARGDRLAANYTNLLSSACKQTGILEDQNILVNGASIVIVPDSENPRSIKEKSLQEAIGFLFSETGPFPNILVSPDFKNEEFIQNLIKNGTELLLKSKHFNILNEESKAVVKEFVQKTGKDMRYYLIALSAYLRNGLSIPATLDGRGLDRDEVFLHKQSKIFLRKFIESLQ